MNLFLEYLERCNQKLDYSLQICRIGRDIPVENSVFDNVFLYNKRSYKHDLLRRLLMSKIDILTCMRNINVIHDYCIVTIFILLFSIDMSRDFVNRNFFSSK